MIEENILEWIELGDTIQRIDLYDSKKSSYFKINYLLLEYSNIPLYFYLLVIFLFFAQIWEINMLKVNTEGDGILEILKYLEKIFLLRELITNNTLYIILLTICLLSFISSIILCSIILILLNHNRKNRFLISLNAFINIINVYYLSGPTLEILLSSILCYNDSKLGLCSFKNISKLISLIFCVIFGLFLIIAVFISSLYINDTGNINSSNVKSKTNNNYTPTIVIIKIIYFLVHFFLKFTIDDKYYLVFFGYYFMLVVGNICCSIYSYKDLFYYNYYIDMSFHYGWYYSSWFSICILFKQLIKIQDITLFVIFGLIIITIGFYFSSKYRAFQLITEFNIFEANTLKNIEIYNFMLLYYLKKNDNNSKILIAGVIKRFEEYLSTNSELNEQYHKLINDKHLQKKFTSHNELSILSIICIIYGYNIEKSKDSTDITLNMCYFLINKFKNPLYAIWLCTKIKSCTHTQSFLKYILMEQIKDYLINILNKNTNRLTIKHVEISSVILYYQYVDLFKVKIYDATCSQIEYFDVLKNTITTQKTTENFLKIGEDILSLRKDILNLWEKIISLNPFSNESEKDYMIYLETILQDDVLMKTEEKRFNTLKAEKLSERNNPYYSLFIQDLSCVLLVDGYSYSGKIFYATPNFPSLFMFTGKEILNTAIDDLLPDVIQSFHKYLIEDAIKYSNLGYIFKRQRDVLLKGKNGLIFNVYLYVKPAPNLSFGLIYFAYLQKFKEQNFILILDENLIINGFTGMNQMGSNFTLNNNYGLSYNINGHHVGMVIPEILLQMNYDIKSNTFSLSKNNIDLKGNIYSIHNFKDLDEKITKILGILKERKIAELNNENKNGAFEEYEDFIKDLNSQQSKSFSIFFRIESHFFIGKKYKYYRIYVINDLLSGNENSLSQPSNINSNITDEDNLNFKENENQKKVKLKDLNGGKTISGSQMFNQNFGNKLIRLKTELNGKSNILNKDDADKLNKQIIHKKINLKENDDLNNKQNIIDSSNNNEKTKELNFSKPSNPSSIITQSSAESAEFNKLKNEIINKNDSLYVKLMKYLFYIFIVLNSGIIIYDYFTIKNIINSMIEFLRQNLFFTHTKIATACIYSTTFNFKLIKEKIIVCESTLNQNCHSPYSSLLLKCIKEVRNLKYNISYFYPDFQKIFSKKLSANLFIYNSTNIDILQLDIDNFLNLLLAQGMKILANLPDYFDNKTEEPNFCFFDIYLKNILNNSLKYFHSSYSGFYGEEKEQGIQRVSGNPPIRLIISVILVVILISVFSYYICKINSMEIYFLDRLINFTSNSFDEYLKKLEELKKKFRDDTNDDDDKNLDDLDIKGDDLEGKNDNNSKNNNDKKEYEINHKNSKKKKSKQNKIQQQKIKKKKIMSQYFLKLNLFFGFEIGIILLLSILYFVVTLVITTKMEKNYKEFDSIQEEINEVYFESFKIFLTFKSQIEMYLNNNDKSALNIPEDKNIQRPKIGNALMKITNNNKYSAESLKMLDDIYNNNACPILSNSIVHNIICENLFSSILTKGMEQAIVQMSIIITSCVDELHSLKEKTTILDLYNTTNNYFSYEIFVGEFMLESFLKTQTIFEIFRNDEKTYIYKINRIILFIFCCVYLIFIIAMICIIYSYKNVINSFFNFIGIIPAKFIADDDYLYKTILKLEQDFY